MKIRFNKFEKIAGLFVLGAVLSCVFTFAGLALKNEWFSPKVHYRALIDSADGVHAGTTIQIAGLRVGQVESVDLAANDKVAIDFAIFERFAPKIRKDSHLQMYRPFILGDKVLEISVGSETEPLVQVGGDVPLTPSIDIMDLLSGKKMGLMLGSFDKLADSLRIVGDAFVDPARTHALVEMLDRLNPLVRNLNAMSLEVVSVMGSVNKQKHLETLMTNLTKVSDQLQIILPSFNKEVPDFGQQLGQIVKNLNVLTTEFQKLTPAIATLAPELPRTTQRAVEALDETVITLKAMQKSFLLRSKVDEVRKEEEQRKPASN